MTIPSDYEERVYAGVLGKIIGIYLGLPPEGWTYERITDRFGEINYYVHEQVNEPLVGTSDDVTGMFTFIRALPDNDNDPNITAAQIGQTWLNYFIEGRSATWWGGMGISSEHTALVRLLSGVEAPASGSISINGKVMAEQIGARIFVDGWPMLCPGDPERAADFARRAGSVSHDGESVYGAQVLAAMEAQAFVEPDLDKLLDVGLSLIPRDSDTYRVATRVREWHAAEQDWRKTRARIAQNFGYDRYSGSCPIVSNDALVILGLLYGDDDFQQSLMITTTSGWDVDCNASAVGCLLGIKNGLAGINAGPDWRGPVADRLYLPTADGGRAITDAVTETYHIVNTGRALADLEPVAPKDGARFHFELPGSVQCFRPEGSFECRGTLTLENVTGHSACGQRSLALHFRGLAPGRYGRAATATFTPPEAISAMTAGKFEVDREHGWKYNILASPTLYPGQTVRARVVAGEANKAPVSCRLYLRAYGSDDQLVRTYGPGQALEPGAEHEFAWRVADTGGAPVAEVGVEVAADQRADGTLYLDYLTWDGAPDVVLRPQADGGRMWGRAWVDAVDQWEPAWRGRTDYLLTQSRGTGLLIQGTRRWTDYRVSATVSTRMAKSLGIAARVQGNLRYYALLLCDDGNARLVKVRYTPAVLAEAEFPWQLEAIYQLSLQVAGSELTGSLDGHELFKVTDEDRPLTGGAVALVVEEGNLFTDTVTVRPLG